MNERQQVREATADELYDIHLGVEYGCKQVGTRPRLPQLNKNIQQQLFGWADQILNLKHPNGQPMIGILVENQELPDNPNKTERLLKERRMREDILPELPEVEYWQAQRDMLKAGWRRCL